MANAVTSQGLAGACSILLKQARDLMGQNYPMNLGRATGALDFITSPENKGIKAEYISTQGGKKVVSAKILYKQRSLPCEVKSGANAMIAGLCDTASTPLEKSTTMTINDRLFMAPKAFKNSDLVQICQGSTEFIQEYLQSDQRALREKLDEKVLAKIAVARGVNNRQDGNITNATTTPTLYTRYNLLGQDTAANKIPLSANWNDVLMDYQNNQFHGQPAFIGQGNLQTFYNLAGFNCCNSTTPYGDAIARSGSAFYLDQAVNTVLGIPATKVTRALMVAYGASHLLWFNENKNIQIDNDLIKHITLPDPVYPQLMWDVDFKWDECAKQWVYSQSAYFDVFNAFQADSFKVDSPSPNCDDELYGETGIWGYEFQSV